MRNLTTTVALIALVTIWPEAGAGQEAGSSALRDAIAAQQDQTLEAAEAAAGDEAPLLFAEEELDELVAPVALYPDALLAQVLVAAAFPLQVAKADQLIESSPDMGEDELSDALARQEFDPSVLVLMSGFPTVVSRMADDLDWTERLGQAMLAQDDDVLAAVQRMRAEADATGNLTSNAAQVIEKDDDQIYIKPADPEVVYVPSYDPQTVYTTYSPTPPAQYIQPQTSTNPLANPLTAGALAFGGALLLTELFDDDDDGGNNNKNGWDDYWHNGRPIDWRDREFYPRPVYGAGVNRQTWASERDRFWDRRAEQWRRNDAESIRAYEAGRQDTLRSIQRNHTHQADRMREAAREERARADARRDQVFDRAKADRNAAEKQRRQEEAKAADARKDRQEKAATAARQRQKEDAKSAADQKKRRDTAAEAAKLRQQEEAKAAATAKERRLKAEQAKAGSKQRQEQEAKAAAEKQRKLQADRKARAEAEAQAARKQQQAAEAQKSKAANRKQADKDSAAKQKAQYCKNHPKDKQCG